MRHGLDGGQGGHAGIDLGGGLVLPASELIVRATRSGGPGGQHVNTSSTRIEIVWNVRTSAVLSDAERERLLARLARRLDAEGNVRVVASDTRSQRQNRSLAESRLAALVRSALAVPRPRRKTRPNRGAVEERLAEKRRRSEKKRRRGNHNDE